jgi:dihydrofolate synthase/folylpolyglutamate synthase
MRLSTIKLGSAIPNYFSTLSTTRTRFQSVQIAGTNGKGSTAAMLDSICRAAGIKTGLYTSPHLVSITERIKSPARNHREEFAACATPFAKFPNNSKLSRLFSNK